MATRASFATRARAWLETAAVVALFTFFIGDMLLTLLGAYL